MSLFDWLQDWFHAPAAPADPDLARALEMMLRGTDPRFRLLSRAEARLQPVVSAALAYCREQAARLPGPLALGPGRWAADPSLRAWFARSSELAELLGSPGPLRECLNAHPEADTLWAVLSQGYQEKQRVGTAFADGLLQSDVVQRLAIFTTPRLALPALSLALPALSLAALLELVCWRMFEQLVLESLGYLTRLRRGEQPASAAQGLLQQRLDLLHQGQAGLAASHSPATAPTERQALQAAIAGNEAALHAQSTAACSLEDCFAALLDYLAKPELILGFATLTLHLDAMNVLQPAESTPGLEMCQVSVLAPEPRQRILALVQIARDDCQPVARPSLLF